MKNKKSIHIVGGGPSGMFAAYLLAKEGFEVHLFEQKPALGRKFLVAGHNGLNLTNALTLSSFIEHYNRESIKSAVTAFTPADLRAFFSEIGISTFIGTSGKIFPTLNYKPIEVLNHWIDHLIALKVNIYLKHSLKTVETHSLIFDSPEGEKRFDVDQVIFALGGASWKSTGSDGDWMYQLQPYMSLLPFQASNAGFVMKNWEQTSQYAGLPLKNIAIHLAKKTIKGELVISELGLEGGPIYASNGLFREGITLLYIDLKPEFNADEILLKLAQAKNSTAGLKSLKLSKAAIGLIKTQLSKTEFIDSNVLAQKIKNLPLTIHALYPIDRAISTVGGIAISSLDENFKATAIPSWYFLGEMVDWDAPTGGYLLQACFSMAAKATKSIILDQSLED